MKQLKRCKWTEDGNWCAHCLDREQAPFGKGTLVRFRAALIASGGDRRLVEKTIEIAKKTQGYSERSLRAALYSSPLWGAARVEDTHNLLGHALRKSLEIIAKNTQQDLASLAVQAGAKIVATSSLKRALDLGWDDPAARKQALSTTLQALNQAESWIESQPDLTQATAASAQKSLAEARIIEEQDIERRADGSPKLCQGVARNRRFLYSLLKDITSSASSFPSSVSSAPSAVCSIFPGFSSIFFCWRSDAAFCKIWTRSGSASDSQNKR